MSKQEGVMPERITVLIEYESAETIPVFYSGMTADELGKGKDNRG